MVRPAHFVERHGLVVIIAIGIGAAALFRAGQIYFRRRLKIGANRFRIIAIAQVAALVLVFGVLPAVEDQPRA